ncbi:MAG: NUDIX domain-containing protein [Alphaproteobacteria bacterium]|nr:NUDIX domain-containing protein [Alphaproteobacteria bacterium]MDD9920110.1 NUDIX domain-containing protein [Alphaproteobacteria bacterium]
MAELLDIVDENDVVIGQKSRDDVYEKGLMHRTVQVLVINEAGELIVQWRSAHKKKNPRVFMASVGETVQAGESYEDAAVRGLKEELGATDVELKPLGLIKIRNTDSPRNSMAFIADYSGEVTGWEEEAEVLDYWDADEAEYVLQRFPYLLADSFRESLTKLFEKLEQESRVSEGEQ